MVPWVVHLCGVLAPLAGVGVALSPMPTILRIQQQPKGAYAAAQAQQLPLLPYTMMVVNAVVWFAYGYLQGEVRIWSCNAGGAILGLYYFVSFLQTHYRHLHRGGGNGDVRQHIQAIVGAVSVAVFFAIVVPTSANPAYYLGRLGMLLSVVMFASPLAVIRVVMETKSARSIPLPFTVACIVNCLLWSVFGLWQVHDPCVYVPNLLGLLLTMTQLGLKLYYDPNVLTEFTRELTAKKQSAAAADDDANKV
jgi:solute carrier family 50 (sugar transporter)